MVIDMAEFERDPLIVANTISMIMQLQKVAVYPVMVADRAGDGVKFEWLDAYVADNPGEQIVVFSKFRDVALEVQRRYKSALVIGGREPHLLDAFKAERVQVLSATIAAGGTGLDLPKPRTAVFMDREWSSILMTQAEERIDRIFGRKNNEPKHIIYLEAVKSVDRLVRRRVEDKLTDIQMVYEYMQGYDNG
jgi:SNF2 family DNA or RNA helicase